MESSVGFGLDLAGFSKPKSTALVAIEVENSSARLTILANSPFNCRLVKGMSFPKRLEEESSALSTLLKLGPVAVDVPIDLQGLPGGESMFPWELTLRPIDKALGGLPPLASWLGACVARFRAVLEPTLKNQLGVRLSETYPAASLTLCGVPNRQYKSGEEAHVVLSAIASSFLIPMPADGEFLTHDELDACICAITAVASGRFVLEGCNLQDVMIKRLGSDGDALRMKPPVGYRLLPNLGVFECIEIGRQPYKDWLTTRLGQA